MKRNEDEWSVESEIEWGRHAPDLWLFRHACLQCSAVSEWMNSHELARDRDNYKGCLGLAWPGGHCCINWRQPRGETKGRMGKAGMKQMKLGDANKQGDKNKFQPSPILHSWPHYKATRGSSQLTHPLGHMEVKRWMGGWMNGLCPGLRNCDESRQIQPDSNCLLPFDHFRIIWNHFYRIYHVFSSKPFIFRQSI